MRVLTHVTKYRRVNYVCVCVFIHTLTYPYIQTQINACTLMPPCTHAYMHAHAYIHTYIHTTNIHRNIHTYYIHTTNKHTYIHTIHTYIDR
jgi:hypothetical protein